MASIRFTRSDRGSFLLELLHYAGWQLQIRRGSPTRIHAARDGIELDITRASLSEAAGVIFARAMRSGRHGRQTEDG